MIFRQDLYLKAEKADAEVEIAKTRGIFILHVKASQLLRVDSDAHFLIAR
ncbi:hypothetical protein NIES2107_68810 (plasmid) [Nostoc carneum NIES-2107]|nr:hypothetical protein NIES2107_68810 [Nostoc carneum NIES-2107]